MTDMTEILTSLVQQIINDRKSVMEHSKHRILYLIHWLVDTNIGPVKLIFFIIIFIYFIKKSSYSLFYAFLSKLFFFRSLFAFFNILPHSVIYFLRFLQILRLHWLKLVSQCFFNIFASNLEKKNVVVLHIL